MNIMTSRPRTRVSVQAPFGGVIDWYPEPRFYAAPVISISSDVSVESVGSSFSRVILIGSISVEVPVAPKVGAAEVASPAGVPELDTYSSSEADPLESSPPPYLWRSRVALRSSSPTTSTLEIPTAPILPAPSTIVAPSSEALTAKKSVGPLPSHRLALRYTSHHLDHFTSRSSSSPFLTSDSFHHLGAFYYPGHFLIRLTTGHHADVDSSSHRDLFSSLARTYDVARILSLFRDVVPSATVTSSISMLRGLVPSRAKTSLPRDVRCCWVAKDRDVMTGVDAGIGMEVDVGVNVEDEVEDEVESSDRGTMEVGVDVVAGIDIPDAMLMPDAVERLEQRELESRSLIADGERASLLEQVASLERSNARLRGTMMMDRARAGRFWRRVRFIESELRQIRRFCYYDRLRFRRLETFAARRLEHDYHSLAPLCCKCSRRWKVKAKTTATVIMEMVEMEMVEIEMVENGNPIRIIGMQGLVVRECTSKTAEVSTTYFDGDTE
ncbi:hypothetical protein Tco_0209430 [Tanacetum coccineum]